MFEYHNFMKFEKDKLQIAENVTVQPKIYNT